MRRIFDGAEVTRGLSWRQFFAIVCAFWVYVAASNVLYTYGLRIGISKFTTVMLFSPWNVRVLQHLFLLPPLLASYWASLIVDWRPLWRGIVFQAMLGAAFAAMAYPAIGIAQFMCGDTMHDPSHMMGTSHFWQDPALPSLWFASFMSFLVSYFFGLALLRGAVIYKRFRDAELQVAALERETHAARLSALRMQLSPHTLFNLLHTIRGNIEWDPRGAQAMVVQLADLLRRLLNAGERDYSRLTEELQFARLYLELHQRRFEDRISVVLPEQAKIPAVWVPSLILQPLVENAIVHGLAGHQGPIRISLGAETAGETLTLRVTNTVAPQSVKGQDGIGLNNVRERLAVQFGAAGTLSYGRERDQWSVEIRMPLIFAIEGA
jgi:two-component system, LytTR family, sensor kinase